MVIKKGYLFSKKIGIGDYFDDEKDAAYVELKECGVELATQFQGFAGDTTKAAKFFKEILSVILVDHNLYFEEGVKATNAEVIELLDKRGELFLTVMGEYITGVLFTHGKKSEGK